LANDVGLFDYVLADLGVSSMQIDDPERGFSYKTEGPLDLRLNPQKGYSAAERLREISVKELEGMLIENADEPFAEKIAKAIVYNRKKKAIETTTELREIIENTLQGSIKENPKEAIKKSCQRTFQALRIDVNNEYEVLEAFLEKLPYIMKENGRIAILTFHSGEDRLVKKTLKEYYKSGQYSEIAKEVIRPSKEEQFRNGRARAAKMRWAIKA
jgi:16S rRNA (cytosine1402-N4)-methyltransferase